MEKEKAERFEENANTEGLAKTLGCEWFEEYKDRLREMNGSLPTENRPAGLSTYQSANGLDGDGILYRMGNRTLTYGIALHSRAVGDVPG